MQQKNFYIVLGIKNTASVKEIKTAYRNLAKKHHPDKNFSDNSSEEYFKEIQQAYFILSNPNKRREYDLNLGLITYQSYSKQHTPNAPSPYSFVKTTSNNKKHASDFSDEAKQNPEYKFDSSPFLISVIVALLLVFFIIWYKI